MKESTSRFTPAMIERMTVLYGTVRDKNDDTRREAIKQLAAEFSTGKEEFTARSIIGKLSTLPDVDYRPYNKAAPKVRSATNQEIVTALAATMGLPKGALDSLTRGSKAALQSVVDFVAEVQAEPETKE